MIAWTRWLGRSRCVSSSGRLKTGADAKAAPPNLTAKRYSLGNDEGCNPRDHCEIRVPAHFPGAPLLRFPGRPWPGALVHEVNAIRGIQDPAETSSGAPRLLGCVNPSRGSSRRRLIFLSLLPEAKCGNASHWQAGALTVCGSKLRRL